MTDEEHHLLRLAVARGVEGEPGAFALVMAPVNKLRERVAELEKALAATAENEENQK